MTDDLGIAERLGEVSRRMRSPLARDLAGELTDDGRRTSGSLRAILDDLSKVEARTPADALALASIAGDLLEVLAANAEGGPLAQAAVFSLAQALAGLKTCLSEMSGRQVEEFAVVLPLRPTPSH